MVLFCRLDRAVAVSIHVDQRRPEMSILCRARIKSRIKWFNYITIWHDFNQLAEVTTSIGDGYTRIVDRSLIGRMTASGKIPYSIPGTSYLLLMFEPAVCSDSGHYVCAVSYNTFNNVTGIRKRFDVTVHSEYRFTLLTHTHTHTHTYIYMCVSVYMYIYIYIYIYIYYIT